MQRLDTSDRIGAHYLSCTLSAAPCKHLHIVLQATGLSNTIIRRHVLATPPGPKRARDGVLRWMEAYADALESGMFKVSTCGRVGPGCSSVLCDSSNAKYDILAASQLRSQFCGQCTRWVQAH